jgi:hypothetical protein
MVISRLFIGEIKTKLDLIILLPFVDPSNLGVPQAGREILWRVVDFSWFVEPRRFSQAYFIEAYANDIIKYMKCEPNLPKCSKNFHADHRRSGLN